MMTPFFGLSLVIHFVIIAVGKLFQAFGRRRKAVVAYAALPHDPVRRRMLSFLIIALVAASVVLSSVKAVYLLDSNNYENIRYLEEVLHQEQKREREKIFYYTVSTASILQVIIPDETVPR